MHSCWKINKNKTFWCFRNVFFSDGNGDDDIVFETFADSLVASLISWRHENPILKTFGEEMIEWWSRTQSIVLMIQWSFGIWYRNHEESMKWCDLIGPTGFESQALNLIWTSHVFCSCFSPQGCHMCDVAQASWRRQRGQLATWYIFEHRLCIYQKGRHAW